MNTSFEIVPRDEQSLNEQLSFIEENLPFINTINIPDLLRLPIRSWQASEYINRKQYQFIPHFRAIDFSIKDNRLQQIIEEHQLNRVLVVSGDPPPSMAHQVYDTNVLNLIAQIRKDFPNIQIYAGFDPYRSSVKNERVYMQSKFDAGADYLLSQPFFDIRLLEIYSELVPPEKVFWGVSPVVSEKSQSYWQRVNHAIFPQNFEASYEWNIKFAQQVIHHCQKTGSHLYFMPISINLEKYFLPLAEYIGK